MIAELIAVASIAAASGYLLIAHSHSNAGPISTLLVLLIYCGLITACTAVTDTQTAIEWSTPVGVLGWFSGLTVGLLTDFHKKNNS